MLRKKTDEQNQDAWIRDRVKDANRRCERMWGHGWRLLSKDIQDAYVAREVLAVIAQQHDETNLLVQLATAGLLYEEV